MRSPKDNAPAPADTGEVTGFGTNETAAIPAEKTDKPKIAASITIFPYGSVGNVSLEIVSLTDAVNAVTADTIAAPAEISPDIRFLLRPVPEQKNCS